MKISSNLDFMSHQLSSNQKLSDLELFHLCKKYGSQVLEARRKFAGLLPEVYSRRLYEKKGFSSVYEFAAKLAGMSHEQVQRVLQIEKRLEDKPDLKKVLVCGEVSVNKLARVVSIATVDNQQELAEKAVSLKPTAPNYFIFGVACSKNSDRSNALLAIEKAIELDPDNLRYRRRYNQVKGRK